jgi:hypothetical protein
VGNNACFNGLIKSKKNRRRHSGSGSCSAGDHDLDDNEGLIDWCILGSSPYRPDARRPYRRAVCAS